MTKRGCGPFNAKEGSKGDRNNLEKVSRSKALGAPYEDCRGSRETGIGSKFEQELTPRGPNLIRKIGRKSKYTRKKGGMMI